MAPDLWIPLGMLAAIKPEDGNRLLTGRQVGWLVVSGRLRRGTSKARASAEVAAIGRELERAYPQSDQPPQGIAMDGLVDRAFDGFVWSVETSSPIPSGLRLIAAGFLTVLMVARLNGARDCLCQCGRDSARAGNGAPP